MGGVRNRLTIAILTIMTAFLLAAPNYHAFNKANAAELSDNIAIVLAGEISGGEVIVDAFLLQNSGLNGLTVELSYDLNAMTLTRIERGGALASLDYIKTNVDTEKGYAITPFKINWSGDENDSSKGAILKMFFKINEGARDGTYTVTFKTERDRSVTYIANGEVATKNALISGVEVEVKASEPVSVQEETSKADTVKKIIFWVSLGVAVALVAVFVVLLIIKTKGKRSWTKID